jgi:hypothetical protein
MNSVHCLKCMQYMLLQSVKLGVVRNDQELQAMCEMFVVHILPKQSAQRWTRNCSVLNTRKNGEARRKVSNPKHYIT